MFRLFWAAALLFQAGICFDLKDITGKVFGNSSNIIPAAFGDFNSDKLTDMIVLKSVPNDDSIITLQVLLAKEPKVVSSASVHDPLFHSGTRDENLACIFTKGSLTSVVPGDFDGDGGMDILVTIRYTTGKQEAKIIWGHHTDDAHQLVCLDDQPEQIHKVFSLESEPLVFDYDYDYVSDLLIVDSDGNRIVYKLSTNRSADHQIIQLTSNHSEGLKNAHSNSHLDINFDGLPDLILTTQTGLEIYERSLEYPLFRFHKHIAWPSNVTSDNNGCSVDKCVGQIAFADFDLSGTLDLIVPMCYDPECKISIMFLVPLNELWEADTWRWEPVSMDLMGGQLQFYPPNPDKNLLQLMAPRVGDVDLDGFPDLLMPLQNKSSGSNKPVTHLLLNAPCNPYTGCKPFWRQYQVEPEFMKGTTESSIFAIFYDLFEDGRPDILTVNGSKESGFKTTAYTNTSQDSDAYFIKVLVLSGACYHDCKDKSTTYVPYGTNMGGQTVSYRSQRPGPETFDWFNSTAAQLSQSAHFSLQTPYTIFGLGMSPNFIDSLWVTVNGKKHSWPQIIPNSQLYVIPYPKDNAELWEAKISIFPSKSIVITGLAMIGTCGVTVLMILVLHWRERKEDYQAKLQDTNRFHFDAM